MGVEVNCKSTVVKTVVENINSKLLDFVGADLLGIASYDMQG